MELGCWKPSNAVCLAVATSSRAARLTEMRQHLTLENHTMTVHVTLAARVPLSTAVHPLYFSPRN